MKKFIVLALAVILLLGSYTIYSTNKIGELENELEGHIEFKLAIKNLIDKPWKLGVQYKFNSIETKEDITFNGKNDDIIFHTFFGNCKIKPDPEIEFSITFQDEHDNVQTEKLKFNGVNDSINSSIRPSFRIKKLVDTLCSSVTIKDIQAPKSVYTIIME